MLARMLKRVFWEMRQINAALIKSVRISPFLLPFTFSHFPLLSSVSILRDEHTFILCILCSPTHLYVIPPDPTRPVSACYTGLHLIHVLPLVVTGSLYDTSQPWVLVVPIRVLYQASDCVGSCPINAINNDRSSKVLIHRHGLSLVPNITETVNALL